MSNRYSRHQTVISREADSHIDEDHWLKQFEKNLQKTGVQSRRVDQSLFEQISGIMGNKSKHTSVSAAVEDMMHRSGLINYLNNVKTSQQENTQKKKAQQSLSGDKPSLLKKNPNIQRTIENYIRDTKGNLPVPAILEKVKSIHSRDVSENKDWEDPDLLQFISQTNVEEKSKNISSNQDFNLGVTDNTFD